MALFQSIIEISSAIEIYKFLHDLSPAIIMGDITKLNKSPTYNLRTLQELYSRNPKTVRYGTETIFFLTPKFWAIVPQNIKNCSSLSSFKIITRKLKPDCPCQLCKCILKLIGFIWKIIKAKKNLQNIRTAALSFFFFKFNPFQVNVPRKLRDFCVLRAQIETSQFILQTKSGGWFLYGLH